MFEGMALAVERPARVELVHPVTGETLINKATGEPAYIDMYSGDSEVAKKWTRESTTRRLQRRNNKIDGDFVEDNAVSLLTALTSGWSLCTLEGDPIDVPFSAANARVLYSTAALSWVRDQANEGAGNRALFTPASSTN